MSTIVHYNKTKAKGPRTQQSISSTFDYTVINMTLLTHHSAPATQQHHFDRHNLLTTFISHIFAPSTCAQCTASKPCWIRTIPSDEKLKIIIDDEFVLMEEDDDEMDGGPLCREAEIETWKCKCEVRAPAEGQMLAQRKRRLSVHCFGG